VTLRALVVEDDGRRATISSSSCSVGAAEVAGAVATADDREGPHSPPADVAIDVAFVDVQLIGSEVDDEGLELVRPTRKRAAAPLFVLATASRQHALEAFDSGVSTTCSSRHRGRVAQCLERLRDRRPGLEPDAAGTPSRIVARRKRRWSSFASRRYGHSSGRTPRLRPYSRGRFDVDLSLSAVEASFGRTSWRASEVAGEHRVRIRAGRRRSETERGGLASADPPLDRAVPSHASGHARAGRALAYASAR